ncbi:MAG: hypothetical protein Q7R72_01875 [bacterium]|nr:hypothetical protein [bacterium]
MLFSDQKHILLKYKLFYQNIGSIKCPYFDNEPIFFNRKGLNHVMRTGRELREFNARIERLSLLVYCKRILTKNYNDVEYRLMTKGNTSAGFWGFTANIDGVCMKLIVRQIGSGQKHFFSIFPIKH